jgi:hypothetical protein
VPLLEGAVPGMPGRLRVRYGSNVQKLKETAGSMSAPTPISVTSSN